MPAALADLVAVSALVALLVTAFRHPAPRVEAGVAAACAVAVLATGRLDGPQTRATLDHLVPVVLFLVAVLAVAECCRAAGLFDAIGHRLAHRRGANGLLVLTFAVAVVTTVALSLDATVVLVTPVAMAAALRTSLDPRPYQLACVRLANTASTLLPVSNLTNLLAMPWLGLSFGRFAAMMAPVWAIAIAVEYAVLRKTHRVALTARPVVEDGPMPALPRLPLVVVALMLAGFAVTSRWDLPPAWVAGVAAVVLAVRGVARREIRTTRLWHSTHPAFALWAIALGLVVAALGEGVLGDVVRALTPAGDAWTALAGAALLGAVLANLLNNLPATLLLMPVLAGAGAAPVVMVAALVGINVGSSMTWTGSLANLLWRRTVTAHGGRVDSAEFHRAGLLAAPAILVLGVGTLLLW